VSQWLLLSVACATGAAVMIIELMGVRLMAPWFGQSQLVWTNVIGVVLASLAVGQWLGGRWAEHRRHPKPTTLLIIAGALSIASPDIVRLVSPLVLPDDLGLEEAYPFVTLGSLLVSFVAVGVPMLAMGAVAPWLVRLSREASEAPGRVAGAILAAGTLGSLLGTFGATHVLLGAFGSSLTVRFAGGLLLVAGLVLAVGNGGVTKGALLTLLVPAMSIPWPERERSSHVLESVTTPYQDVRVELDADGTRLLRINEGLDSFHSAYRPGDLWTDRYFDAFVVPALMAPESDDGARSICVIGLGGGTMARQVQVVIPDARILGIELDDRLVDLGREWFGLPDSVSVAGGVDGRLALHVVQEQFGAILVDAYAQQIYLPPHLCTREFFEEVKAKLLPGGVAALNLSGRTREDPVVSAVASTFARVFPNASMARIPWSRNMILVGWNGDGPAIGEVRRELQQAGVMDHLGWFVDGDLFSPVLPADGEELVDGNAPVEALAHAAWKPRS